MFGTSPTGGSFFGGDGRGGFLGNLFGPRFSCELKCLPMSFCGREELEFGNRFILPPASLERLQALDLPSPYLFEISDLDGRNRTHGGVLEFIAPEETCYLPYWMLKQLRAEENDVLRISLKQLPRAVSAVFKPSSVALLRVCDQRALLESGLRGFVTLTVGDKFDVQYEGQKYGIEVVQLKPENAAHLVDTDMEVEFAIPKDAEAAAISRSRQSSDDEGERSPKVRIFGGSGQRIDGSLVMPRGEVDDEDSEEFDPMPWKKRIPKGVRHTVPPFGIDMARLTGENMAQKAAAASSSTAPAFDELPSRGRTADGAAAPMPRSGAAFRAASPDEVRANALEAAQVRYALNAEDIEKKRQEEEIEQVRRKEQEEREAREREEERKRKAAAVAAAPPPQEKMTGGANGKGRAPSAKRRTGLCCGCFRAGSGPQTAKADVGNRF